MPPKEQIGTHGRLVVARREVWSELARLYHAGTISAATRRRLQRNLDLETTRLTEVPH